MKNFERKRNLRPACASTVSLLIWALLFMPIVSLFSFSSACAQDQCETALAEAKRNYDAGRLAEVIERLRVCLPDSLPQIERAEAYHLLALAYLAEDYRDEAKAAIYQIFTLNRNYEPDAVQDPQPYRDLVAEVELTIPKSLEQELFGGWKKAPWIAAVALAGYGIGKLIFGAPDEKPLPEPPELPPNNL